MNIFLPFLLILGLLVFSLMVTKTKLVKSANKSVKILGGYLALLFLSMIVFYFLPDDKFQASESIPLDEGKRYELFEDLLDGKEIDENLIINKSSQPYTNDSLHITLSDSEYYSVSVIVERVGTLKDRIETEIYPGNVTFNEFDVSEEVPYPNVEIADKTFTIIRPLDMEINYFMMKKEFTYIQFTDEEWMGDEGFGSSQSNPIIYLKVPADMRLTYHEGLHHEEVK